MAAKIIKSEKGKWLIKESPKIISKFEENITANDTSTM